MHRDIVPAPVCERREQFVFNVDQNCKCVCVRVRVLACVRVCVLVCVCACVGACVRVYFGARVCRSLCLRARVCECFGICLSYGQLYASVCAWMCEHYFNLGLIVNLFHIMFSR